MAKELPPTPTEKQRHNQHAGKGQGRKRCVHCGERSRNRIVNAGGEHVVCCKSCDTRIKRTWRETLSADL